MPVCTLKLIQVRNFEYADFEFSPDINLIFGHNGSGKTTILESLHVLGTGRSFRSNQISKLINKDSDGIAIEAHTTHGTSDFDVLSLKMRKKHGENTEYFIAQQEAKSVAELAAFLPVQLLNLHGYLLLEDAPEHRRKFMDWMMFHVEHSFFSVWQTYQRTLKQRNALIKMRAQRTELEHWTKLLADAGQQLHELRLRVLDEWIPFVSAQCIDLPGVSNLKIEYKQGWASIHNSYADALDEGLLTDIAHGFTHTGPHRADLQFTIDGVLASHVLSTGQQKTFVSFLQLAQVEWLARICGKYPILLVDDLPSELDAQARALLAGKISTLRAQVFITSVERDGFEPFIVGRDYKMFHVEHGTVKVV